MLRWLERNGYDVSYFTGVDSDRSGASSSSTRPSCPSGTTSTGRPSSAPTSRRRATPGWTSRSSAATRSTGRRAGSRARPTAGAPTTEPSCRTRRATPRAASTTTASGNFACDPDPDTWTGLWRQNAPGHDGGRPENSLSGQISWGDATDRHPGAGRRPPACGSGATPGSAGATTLAGGHPGLRVRLGAAGVRRQQPGRPDHPVRHHRRRQEPQDEPVPRAERCAGVRRGDGAVVVGPRRHPRSRRLDRGPADAAGHRQPAVRHGCPARDACRPVWSPVGRSTRRPRPRPSPTRRPARPSPGGNVTISGTAADVGGVVAAVEVSTDGGTTWARATGTTSWTYTFSASDGPVTVQARAIDDAANIGTADSVSLRRRAAGLPVLDLRRGRHRHAGERQQRRRARREVPIRRGRLRSRASASTRRPATRAPTPGTLWSTAGANLGTVTFTGESATRLAGGHLRHARSRSTAGHHLRRLVPHDRRATTRSGTSFASAGVDSPPLHALQGGVDGPNGVYRYGSGGVFPTSSFGVVQLPRRRRVRGRGRARRDGAHHHRSARRRRAHRASPWPRT